MEARESHSRSVENGKFGSLDLLRGCAAMIVMMWHVPGVEGRYLTSGGLAVDLFFLISGFIVAHAYELPLRAGIMSFWRFCKIRAIRLYPLYALGSIIGLLAYLFNIWTGGFALWKLRPILPNLVLAAFMLPRPADARTASFILNDPAWSLFFEVVVNLAYAASVTWLSTRKLCIIVVAAGLSIVSLCIVYGRFNFGDVEWKMFLAIPRVLLSFGLGCIIFRAWRDDQLPHWNFSPILLPIVFGLIVWLPSRICPIWITQLSAVLIVFPLLLIGAVQSKISPALAVFASLSANISYPLYMVHHPLIEIAYSGAISLGWNHHGAYLSAAISAVMLSFMLDYYYDRPIRVWLRAKFY